MFTRLATLAAFILFTLMAPAQNVGIGYLAPSEKLQVDGNIKIGQAIWNSSSLHFLKFGDGNYCYIAEAGDDSMRLQANHITMASLAGNTKLLLNGTLSIKDGTEGANKILTSNATGQASWQTAVSPAPPSANTGFYVMRSTGNQPIPTGAFHKIVFPAVAFSDAGVWSEVFSEYTAPATGVYHFDARVYISPNIFAGVKNFVLAICINNSPVHRIDLAETYNSMTASRPQYYLTGIVKCNVSDKVSVQLYQDTGGDQYILYGGTAFSGYRVY